MQATSQKSKPSKAIYSILANVTLQNKDFNSKFVFTFMFAFSMSHGQIVEKYRDTLLNCVVKKNKGQKGESTKQKRKFSLCTAFHSNKFRVIRLWCNEKGTKKLLLLFFGSRGLVCLQTNFPIEGTKGQTSMFRMKD